jgi:hypothetical protein
MATAREIHSIRAELKEGSDVPHDVMAFDENKQYGQYAVFGVVPGIYSQSYYKAVLDGAVLATILPFTSENVSAIRAVLWLQAEYFVPKTHHRWIKWIEKPPKRDSGTWPESLGSLGWKYWKQNGDSA